MSTYNDFNFLNTRIVSSSVRGLIVLSSQILSASSFRFAAEIYSLYGFFAIKKLCLHNRLCPKILFKSSPSKHQREINKSQSAE